VTLYVNSDISDFLISDFQSELFRQLDQGMTLWPQNKLNNRDTVKIFLWEHSLE